MLAVCDNHDESHTWQLTKTLNDYSEGGPRCSKCGSTDLTLKEEESEMTDEGETTAAVAFRRFRDGDGPLELVEGGVCDPSTARDLLEEFNDLAASSDLKLVEETTIVKRISRAREEEREKAQKQIKSERRKASQRIDELKELLTQKAAEVGRLQAEADRQAGEAFDAGYEQGYQEASEEFEAQLEELKEELESTVQEAREAGYQAGLEAAQQQDE